VSAGRPVDVLVADDHPLYRASLVRALGQHAGLRLVAEAADGTAALERIRALAPAVAVLDMQMPGLSGAAVLGLVMREALPTRVMLLSGVLDDDTVYRAVEDGAAAVLPKTSEARAIVEAIVAVAGGRTVLAPELQTSLATQIRRRARGERLVLSPREQEILSCMAQGISGPQIARRLFVSPSTVKSHTEKLYEKLGVADRGAAVARGMREGLIE
jgi:two-component system nitrate/nitrite response regulator NarL